MNKWFIKRINCLNNRQYLRVTIKFQGICKSISENTILLSKCLPRSY